MSRILATIGVVLFALISVTFSAGAANATPSACGDGMSIYNAYAANGYNQSAWAMWLTLSDMGCFEHDEREIA